jgi:DNA-binding NtrC family response regulator
MGGLAESTILIVEDEPLLAMDIEDVVRAAGCSVIGPFASLADAQQSIRTERLDAAILDINVTGGLIFPVADTLAAADIPFVIVTGYGRDLVPERHCRRPFLQKPYQAGMLLGMLRDMLGKQAAARAQSA